MINNKKISKIANADVMTLIFVAVMVLSIIYFINPLSNVGITSWDRTYSGALLAGISIDLRISNYYKLFFLYGPLLFFSILFGANMFFYIRTSYREIFGKLNLMFLFPIIASYNSRYVGDETEIVRNPLLLSFLFFNVILFLIAFLDKNERLNFSNIILLFVAYMTAVASFRILLKTGWRTSLIFAGLLLLIYVKLILFDSFYEYYFELSHKMISLLGWIPAIICISMEIVYSLIEKGWNIQDYYAIIVVVTGIYIILSVFILWLDKISLVSFRGGVYRCCH